MNRLETAKILLEEKRYKDVVHELIEYLLESPDMARDDWDSALLPYNEVLESLPEDFKVTLEEEVQAILTIRFPPKRAAAFRNSPGNMGPDSGSMVPRKPVIPSLSGGASSSPPLADP